MVKKSGKTRIEIGMGVNAEGPAFCFANGETVTLPF